MLQVSMVSITGSGTIVTPNLGAPPEMQILEF